MSAHGLTKAGLRGDRLPRRRAVNRLMELLAWLAAAIAVALLAIVVFSVAKRATGALSLDLVTRTPVPFSLTPVRQGLANALSTTVVILPARSTWAESSGLMPPQYVGRFRPLNRLTTWSRTFG